MIAKVPFRSLRIRDDFIFHGDARNLDMYLSKSLVPANKYRAIYLDPPWKYADQRKERKDGKTPTRGIGACHHYNLMTMDQLAALPINSLAAERCHLYMWATMPLLPDAIDVMRSWHFSWATVAYVWVKLNPGMVREPMIKIIYHLRKLGLITFFSKFFFKGPGFYTQSNTEIVLLGIKERPSQRDPQSYVRTKPFRHVEGVKDSQIVLWPRMEPHSRKPHIVADSIARMYPHAVPRIEMFSRAYNADYDHFGNELIDADYNLLEYGETVIIPQYDKDAMKWQIVH